MNYHLGYEPQHFPVKNICNSAAGSGSSEFDKRQLILDTIEDLKRSLEDQSVELCGLNDNDDAENGGDYVEEDE